MNCEANETKIKRNEQDVQRIFGMVGEIKDSVSTIDRSVANLKGQIVAYVAITVLVIQTLSGIFVPVVRDKMTSKENNEIKVDTAVVVDTSFFVEK